MTQETSTNGPSAIPVTRRGKTKATLRARLARLEDSARRRLSESSGEAAKALWRKLEAMAEHPRDKPLAHMSLAAQAAYTLFGEVTRREAEEVAARLEVRALNMPGLEKLAEAIRARIVAYQSNKGVDVLGKPLLEGGSVFNGDG